MHLVSGLMILLQNVEVVVNCCAWWIGYYRKKFYSTNGCTAPYRQIIFGRIILKLQNLFLFYHILYRLTEK